MSYPSEILLDLPTIYWRLGEPSGTSAADTSGNGNTGTYIGSPTLGAAGLVTGDADTAVAVANSAIVDQHIESGSFGPTVTAFSIEAIVNFSNLRGTDLYQFVAGFSSGGVDIEIDLNITAGGGNFFGFLFDNGTSSAFSNGGANLATGATYHVVATYDGTNAKLYVNGAVVHTDATIPGLSFDLSPAPTFLAGNDSFGPGDGVAATLDEVAFYEHALSAARIAAHHTAMTGGGGGPGVPGAVIITLGTIVMDSTTQNPSGITWCWTALDGWWDTVDENVVELDQPSGSVITVARRKARAITLAVMARSPNGVNPLGDAVYTAIATMKGVIEPAVFVPITLTVQDPAATKTAQVRLASPGMRMKIFGPALKTAVTFQVPLLAPDPILA